MEVWERARRLYLSRWVFVYLTGETESGEVFKEINRISKTTDLHPTEVIAELLDGKVKSEVLDPYLEVLQGVALYLIYGNPDLEIAAACDERVRSRAREKANAYVAERLERL